VSKVSEQQVLDLVERWADVELRGDADGYGDLLAPDFLGIGPDPHVRIYGGDTAIVEAALRQKTTAMGRDTSGSFRLVVVAIKQEGHWLLANIQLSGPLIPPGTTPPFARPATQEEP
jgi:SnoaL-like domain